MRVCVCVCHVEPPRLCTDLALPPHLDEVNNADEF